ncbi:hypothetical protein A2215_02885 [Candidatus Berkelbacteria bacterium RIFOXYA2_FULL_43_10]|uniref:Uncharacterized protein n=1 Tax=Candidatus Berkelbacteria bacterium RIFOXYA2_FULL_43_10 TaxID=1797472 RepID=A0A1F5E519_9BACT|nr:MAG: hypothetical protein A2215_02885 [Candidatus Berkelbacteria bacterium RIFOXYA2_FULL_43_10]
MNKMANKLKSYYLKPKKGMYLPVIMLASVIFVALAVAVITFALSDLKDSKLHERNISALEVAEAGVNYYMWHLSHDNDDYCDGGECIGETPYGPYSHEFKDQSGQVIGSYDLYITPPALGESVTTVKAVGRLNNSQLDRIVVAELGMPSFAQYAFVIDTECWFGEDEETYGPVHSNTGIHFDGTAHGVVSSASEDYTPASSFGGDGQVHDGVWGTGGPTSYWVYPVPAVDFNRISIDFTDLSEKATENGISLGSSRSNGYYLMLRADDKIDVYRVTRERTSGITTTFIQTRNAPSNGIVYVEDNVWVDGSYNNHITIAAHTSGSGSPIIKIKANLLYQAKDGTSSVGLVAEGDIQVPRYASNNLEIDAAMLSQNGHVWFPYVNGVIKNQITVYGSIGTKLTWTWTWVNGSGTVVSGYRYTSQTYDPYLTLTPPPEFPTTGSYAILNWREE